MSIAGFDHTAIPIENVDAMLAFYRRLGFDVRPVHPPNFYSAHCGDQKINFHAPGAWRNEKFTLRGPTACPGCGDFCFVWGGSEAALAVMLAEAGAAPIAGPVAREGGRGVDGQSTYFRDPDGNLLEFIVYPP